MEVGTTALWNKSVRVVTGGVVKPHHFDKRIISPVDLSLPARHYEEPECEAGDNEAEE